MVLGLLWNGNAYSQFIDSQKYLKAHLKNPKHNLFLKCDRNIFYINTYKKIVGHTYYDKKEQKYIIYDWYYKKIKFEKNHITFYDPTAIFGIYTPRIAPFNKIKIDRRGPTVSYYFKDEGDLHWTVEKLPIVLKDQAKRLLDWKRSGTDDCSMFKATSNANARFMSKKEWDNIQKKELKKKNTNKF